MATSKYNDLTLTGPVAEVTGKCIAKATQGGLIAPEGPTESITVQTVSPTTTIVELKGDKSTIRIDADVGGVSNCLKAGIRRAIPGPQ